MCATLVHAPTVSVHCTSAPCPTSSNTSVAHEQISVTRTSAVVFKDADATLLGGGGGKSLDERMQGHLTEKEEEMTNVKHVTRRS